MPPRPHIARPSQSPCTRASRTLRLTSTFESASTIDVDGRPITLSRGEAAARPRDQEDLSTARSARQQANAVRLQLSHADEVAGLGLLILRTIAEYITTTNPQEAAGPARRLIDLNPARETMVGLMAGATRLVETGTKLKRQALGMEVIKGAAEIVAPTAGAASIKNLRDRLSPEALMSLRKIVQEAARMAPTASEPEDAPGDA